MMEFEEICYKPIGVIHSPFKSTDETPYQPSAGSEFTAWVEIYKPYIEAIEGLERHKMIILVCHLHEVKEKPLKVIPRNKSSVQGVFSTRSPRRPNPIAISKVELLEVKDNKVIFRGVDLIDGTPVLDIKPALDEKF